MIQLLIIGRAAGQWASKLDAAGHAIEVATERLPAAGVRQIERSPPDVVVIQAPSAIRALSLAIAVKSRPIGEFIPVIAIAPDNVAENAPGREDVEALLPPEATVQTLVRAIEDALGFDANELNAAEVDRSLQEPTSPAHEPLQEPSQEEESEFELVEIETQHATGPTKLRARDIFGARHGSSVATAVDEPQIRRKLRSVRHEDYFVILEVPRSAETQAVRDAYFRLRQSYTDAIEFDLAHRYQFELEEIRDALEDAWAVLGDGGLRAAYLERTTR